jgi:hypothetical protein
VVGLLGESRLSAASLLFKGPMFGLGEEVFDKGASGVVKRGFVYFPPALLLAFVVRGVDEVDEADDLRESILTKLINLKKK